MKYLLGYRAPEVELYRTKLKPLGKVVAGAGFISLAIAIIPNGLGFVFYPLGFGLLGLIGINPWIYKKRLHHKIRSLIWMHK